MLLSCRVLNGQPEYSVHKQGLLVLRSFGHKKLRIIFNITHSTHDLTSFNALFMGQQASSEDMASKSDPSISVLRVSKHYKELSHNRVLLFLDAYENSQDSHMLIFGYLVASVFLYHNRHPLSHESRLTLMLARLRGMLAATDVQQLQQQVKYTSGCAKKPYFLCLFQQPGLTGGPHQHFREFYKYSEGNSTLNEAVDALIDYFPDRSAIELGDYLAEDNSRQTVARLGVQYMESILGRKMFNFEITGSSLENLCFELCDVFNSRPKAVDLVRIYAKIIDNQKTQVLDNTTEIYSNYVRDLLRFLPYDYPELVEAHARISDYTLAQSMEQAGNCMTFAEYQPIYQQIRATIESKFKELKQTNLEKLRDRALQCYQQLEDDEALAQNMSSIDSGNYEAVLQTVQDKLAAFMEQNLPESTARDLLGKMIARCTQGLAQGIGRLLAANENTVSQMAAKIQRLQFQNRLFQQKAKQLESQFIYLHSINNEFKQKLLSLQSSTLSTQNPGKCAIPELRKKIMELEVELIDRNQVIEGMGAVLDKFELEFSRKYYRPKFTKDVQEALAQVTHKINDVYALLSEVRKTEKWYEQVSAQFEARKSQIYTQSVADKQELKECKEKLDHALREKQALEETLHNCREVISSLKTINQKSKETINDLENGCNLFKCYKAELEADLERHRKGLALVASYCETGRGDKLRDFIKVIGDEQLKDTLRRIYRK